MKKYKKKPFDCDDKCSQAGVTIWLNCEDSCCVHIKGVKSLHEIWLILKNQYKLSNLASQDNAVSWMLRQTQSYFSTIAKYRKVIKKDAAKYIEIGNFVADWLLSSFFCLGLNANLKPYTF